MGSHCFDRVQSPNREPRGAWDQMAKEGRSKMNEEEVYSMGPEDRGGGKLRGPC